MRETTHTETRTESEQKEHEEAKDQPSVVGRKDAVAALSDLLVRLMAVRAIVVADANGVFDRVHGDVGLVDAF